MGAVTEGAKARAGAAAGTVLVDLLPPTVAQATAVNHIQTETARRRLAAVQRIGNFGEAVGITLAVTGHGLLPGAIVYGASRLTSFTAERWARRINRRAAAVRARAQQAGQ